MDTIAATPIRRMPPATRLVSAVGGRFSAELGIRLTGADSSELFKWLLAATLFGARISENLAKRTYRELAKEKLVSPQGLLRRGWDGIVKVLDRGGYTRYDFKTATKVLELSTAVMDHYGGDLNKLHESAVDPVELVQKIKELAKGIGDVTANIFLRELRGVWQKAEPPLSEPALKAAKDLRMLPSRVTDKARALQLLKQEWIREGNRLEAFPDFEAALVRYGLALRRGTAAKRRPTLADFSQLKDGRE